MIRPSFDLDWGVTASLGWFFGDDGWYIGARFDWLESTSAQTRGPGFFLPANFSLYLQGAFLSADTMQTRLQVNYYMLDVMLQRGSFLSGCVSMDPHLGLKTAWFYFRGNYVFLGTEGVSPNNTRRRIHTDSWGVGPEFGLDLDWNLASGISLYGESGLSILFGQSKPKDSDHFGTDLDAETQESRDVAFPSLRLAIGLKFSWCLCENRHFVYLKVAFDSVFYWNQFDHIDDVAVGDFSNLFAAGKDFFQVVASDNNTYSLMGLKVVAGWIF